MVSIKSNQMQSQVPLVMKQNVIVVPQTYLNNGYMLLKITVI